MYKTKLIKRNLLGIPIHDITMKDLTDLLNQKIINNEKVIAYGYSVGIYGRLKEIPEFN